MVQENPWRKPNDIVSSPMYKVGNIMGPVFGNRITNTNGYKIKYKLRIFIITESLYYIIDTNGGLIQSTSLLVQNNVASECP